MIYKQKWGLHKLIHDSTISLIHQAQSPDDLEEKEKIESFDESLPILTSKKEDLEK